MGAIIICLIHDVICPPCPECGGEGGGKDYFGEWSGCKCCNPNEDREEKTVRIWFWQVWMWEYKLWKLDRWVDKEVAKMKKEDTKTKPTCPACHKGGYSEATATDGRPEFHCGHCGNTWTNGSTGGEYVRPNPP